MRIFNNIKLLGTVQETEQTMSAAENTKSANESSFDDNNNNSHNNYDLNATETDTTDDESFEHKSKLNENKNDNGNKTQLNKYNKLVQNIDESIKRQLFNNNNNNRFESENGYYNRYTGIFTSFNPIASIYLKISGNTNNTNKQQEETIKLIENNIEILNKNNNKNNNSTGLSQELGQFGLESNESNDNKINEINDNHFHNTTFMSVVHLTTSESILAILLIVSIYGNHARSLKLRCCNVSYKNCGVLNMHLYSKLIPPLTI